MIQCHKKEVNSMHKSWFYMSVLACLFIHSFIHSFILHFVSLRGGTMVPYKRCQT